MAKTVALVSDAGRLVDVRGTTREDSTQYSAFSKRLIGANGTTAVIDYGWNGAQNASVTRYGKTRGQLLTLDAQTVLVTGSLKVGGVNLQTLIDQATDLSIRGITGKTGEIDIVITENTASDSSSAEQPRLSCVVRLSEDFLDRISSTEDTLENLLRFNEVYTPGNGLRVDRSLGNNLLEVNIGSGLKFSEEPSSGESTKSVMVDVETAPVQGSAKPITSGAVYDALQGGAVLAYSVGIDAETGNMTLYRNIQDDSSSESYSYGSSGYSDSPEPA